MSIGRALDRMIDTALIGLGDLVNRFFDTHWPMQVADRAHLAATAFAEKEAETEVWELGELDPEVWEMGEVWSDNPIYAALQEQWSDE